MESREHKMLKQVALRWVRKTGCCVFTCEISWAKIGIVDVAGVKENGDVYIVEAKASNADMRADVKRNKIYKFLSSRSIDFVYYIVEDGVKTDGLPATIGILDSCGRVCRRAQRNRESGHSIESRLATFSKFARALSWRAYGHVINHEQEQREFSLMKGAGR